MKALNQAWGPVLISAHLWTLSIDLPRLQTKSKEGWRTPTCCRGKMVRTT